MIEIMKTENGVTTTARFDNTLDAAAAVATIFDVPISKELEAKRSARDFNRQVRAQLKGLSSTNIHDVLPGSH